MIGSAGNARASPATMSSDARPSATRHRLVARLELDAERAAIADPHRTLRPLRARASRDFELRVSYGPPPVGHNSCLASSTVATERPDSFTSLAAAATSSPLLARHLAVGR